MLVTLLFPSRVPTDPRCLTDVGLHLTDRRQGGGGRPTPERQAAGGGRPTPERQGERPPGGSV